MGQIINMVDLDVPSDVFFFVCVLVKPPLVILILDRFGEKNP